MKKTSRMFSFNIPTETKNEFQSVCRVKCLGMTSVLNFYIQKFIEENRTKNHTGQHDDQSTTDHREDW